MSITDNSNSATVWHKCTHPHTHAGTHTHAHTRARTQCTVSTTTVHCTCAWSNIFTSYHNLVLNETKVFSQQRIGGTDEMFERGKDLWFTHTHTHTHSEKTFLPVILVVVLKPLWKWCGLSVKEVNAEIETLDYRRKNTAKPASIPLQHQLLDHQ